MAKGPDAFRTISEAAEEVGVPQHVLRFWETKFAFIRPMKRAGGRRFYRPQDLVVLRGVRALLHEDGYTIKGVQKLYRESGASRIVAAGSRGPGKGGDHGGDAEEAPPLADAAPGAAFMPAGGLDALLADLEAAKARLDAALKRG